MRLPPIPIACGSPPLSLIQSGMLRACEEGLGEFLRADSFNESGGEFTHALMPTKSGATRPPVCEGRDPCSDVRLTAAIVIAPASEMRVLLTGIGSEMTL